MVVPGDLTDDEWERLAPLLPSMAPQRGGRWRDHRQVINGILWRTENGAKWHELPDRYGPWKTCYHRFSVWSDNGIWARVLQRLQADADAGGDLDWRAQADSTVVRAHQSAAGARKKGSPGMNHARSRAWASRGAG
jgi:transposase